MTMNKKQTIIAGRFVVSPALNQLMDKTSGQLFHLEPRIMAVLEHLLQHADEVVSREYFVSAIWHDYGGGDEGLSQAISYLRKILHDHQKELIRTVPKKGYRLAADVAVYREEATRGQTRILKSRLKIARNAAAIMYILLTTAYFIHSNLHKLPPSKYETAFVSHPEFQPAVSRPNVSNSNQIVPKVKKFQFAMPSPKHFTTPKPVKLAARRSGNRSPSLLSDLEPVALTDHSTATVSTNLNFTTSLKWTLAAAADITYNITIE